MRFIKLIIYYLLFLFFISSNIFSFVPIAKKILADESMKGAIVSLKIVQSVCNFESEKLLNLFKKNVENFPIEDLEKDITEQNPNLKLIPYSKLLNIFPDNEKKLKYNTVKMTNSFVDYYSFVGCPARYKILSRDTMNFYLPVQGFTINEIYSRRNIKKYFDLFDVDVLLFVKINIDSNYQGEMSTDTGYYSILYVYPFHAARIMIIAIDRNFKLVGYNPNYRYVKEESAFYLNVFEGSHRDHRKLEDKFLDDRFVLEDSEEREIYKMEYFFQEFYSNLYTTKEYITRKNLFFTTETLTDKIGLDLKISNTKNAMNRLGSDMKRFFTIM